MGSDVLSTIEMAQTRFVRNGSVNIPCEVHGSGEPVVLVHGWTLHQRMFRPQVEGLSRNFRVITFDRRGCGLSSAEPDLAADLQDLNLVITELAAGSACVLGMSQGGRLALRFALSYPERVKKLILQGAPLDGFQAEEPPGEEVPMAAYADLIRSGRIAEMRALWLKHPMMRAGLSEEDMRFVSDIVSDYRGLDLLNFDPNGSLPADLQAALKRLCIPILVINGRLEMRARQAHSDRLLELLPAARSIELEHSGHMCNISEPDAYNRAVQDFCGSGDKGQA